MNEKLTVQVETMGLIVSRAREVGLTVGAYLDSLVRHDDLRARMQRDADAMVRAGLDTLVRTHRNAAIIAAVRPADPAS